MRRGIKTKTSASLILDVGRTTASAMQRTWTAHPEAEAFLQAILDQALANCPQAQAFERELRDKCAIRLRDTLDHVGVPGMVRTHADSGWKQIELGVWRHFAGSFPDIVERNQIAIAFKVANVEHFVRALGVDAPIEGAPHGPYRRARIFSGPGVYFDAVERHGWIGYESATVSLRTIEAARLHLQSFRTRHRPFRRAPAGLRLTKRMVAAAIADLGKHWACDLFMQAERDYWVARCEAGAIQQRRQERLGVGWCNVDHYAYECSRETFDFTVGIFERLGYECRELVYSETGNGAQVMEQPALRSTVLLNVDMAPEEAGQDIAHRALSPLTLHGASGLWTALHGESMLEAGPSGLAGLYDHNALRERMCGEDVPMVATSSAPSLHQSRTHAERRAVDPKRVDALEKSGHIALEEADDLRFNGARATYFGGVERAEGFKGFAPAGAARTEAVTFELPAGTAGRAPQSRRERLGRVRLQGSI